MNLIDHDFIYIIPIEDDPYSNYSPFQGFSSGIMQITDFIEVILKSPTNTLELSVDRDKAISLRMSGSSSYKIVPIEKSCSQPVKY